MTNNYDLLIEIISGMEKKQGTVFAHMSKARYMKMSLWSSKITVRRLARQLLS